jgi:hypothetical protein
MLYIFSYQSLDDVVGIEALQDLHALQEVFDGDP